jgi:hypothetical protein
VDRCREPHGNGLDTSFFFPNTLVDLGEAINIMTT